MNFWTLILFFGFGFVSVITLTPLIIRWRAAHATTEKSFHHTHKVPISRLGGVALAAAFILVAAAITFLGYGTLLTSSYPPLQSIGVVSAVSVVTLAAASVLVLPALLMGHRR